MDVRDVVLIGGDPGSRYRDAQMLQGCSACIIDVRVRRGRLRFHERNMPTLIEILLGGS